MAFKKSTVAVQAPTWYQLVAPVFDMEFTDTLQNLADDITKLGEPPQCEELSDKQLASMEATLRRHMFVLSHMDIFMWIATLNKDPRALGPIQCFAYLLSFLTSQTTALLTQLVQVRCAVYLKRTHFVFAHKKELLSNPRIIQSYFSCCCGSKKSLFNHLLQ